jgi:hypothetical protein
MENVTRYIPYSTVDDEATTWYHACIDGQELGDMYVYLTWEEAVAQAERFDEHKRT